MCLDNLEYLKSLNKPKIHKPKKAKEYLNKMNFGIYKRIYVHRF